MRLYEAVVGSVVLQQLPRVDPKTLANAGDVVDGHVPLRSLDRAEVVLLIRIHAPKLLG
jgi:hypothetical protein